jgi:hypothetical protein
MFDANGRFVSLHARSVDCKGVHPKGHKANEIIMADAAAQQILRGERRDPCDVLIAEGGPDFLAWATRWSDAAENAPAVFSVLAGSWTEAIAERVPDGSRVLVATHEDESGDEYARKVCETLAGRCELFRFRYAEAA